MTALTLRHASRHFSMIRALFSTVILLSSGVIEAQTLYSRADGAWETASLWSTSEGGGSCACTPSETDDVVVLHDITYGSGISDILDMDLRNEGSLTLSGGTLSVDGSMTLSGTLDVQGGTINVGSPGSATDLDYDQTDVGVVPSIEVSSGTLLVYGGINPAAGAGSDPFSFTQSGGTVDLNNGTSRTADEVLGITNVTGSVFTMSDGLIYVRDTNTDADPEFDIGGANVSHTVTGGSIYFGSASTTRTFEFVPYASIQQPSFRIDGSGGSTLRPNACGDFTLLSLHIEGDDYFDVSNGMTPCSNTMTITSTYDGTYSLYISDRHLFEPRTGTIHLSGTGTIHTDSHVNQGPFYHLRCSDAGQTVTIGNDMHINGELTLGDGAFYVPNNIDFRIAGSATTVSPINKTASTTFTGSGWIRLGMATAARTYNLAGGDYGEMLIGTAGNENGSLVTVEQQGDISAKIIAVVGDFTAGRPSAWNTNDHNLTLSEHLWVGRGGADAAQSMNLGSSTIDLGRDLWVESGGTLNMGSAQVSIGEDLEVNTGNGSTNGVINAGTSTVTFDESGDWTVHSDNNANVVLYDLVLNRTGSLTLTDADLEVSNNVTFTEGTMITNVDDTFTLQVGATVSGSASSSFVSGPQRRVTKSTDPISFLVGKGGVVRELIIRPSTSDSTAWAVEYFDSAPPAGPVNGDIEHIMPTEYWDVTRVSGTSGAFFDVTWINFDVPDPSKTVVAHFNGTSWDDLGGTPNGSGASGSISSTVELTSFSPIALGSTDASNTLPVELTDFSGYVNGAENELRWTTKTEINNDYFSIERSLDGFQFEAIGMVQGAGTTTSEINYEFTDRTSGDFLTYYRLKQVDFDGTFAYSPVIALQGITAKMSVYPNPAIDFAQVDLPFDSDWSVRLLDQSGRVLEEYEAASVRIHFDLRGRTSGLYFVSIIGGGLNESHLLLKE